MATLIDTMNSVRRCCGSTLQDAAGGQFSGCCEGQPYSGDSSCCEGGMLLPKDKQYWEGKYESFDECVFQESASPHSLAGGFGGALVGGLVSLGNWGGVLGGTVAGVYGTAAVRCGLFICDNESE